ncbi:hypothetical protein ABE151_17505 [Bacillus paralicheniformis]|jgi:hypothetical protein|uniref:hypothetical protein n=1 Tax=Bacillus paralicheniformis TaxID=1648923 RepID=UPI003D1A4912
MKSLTGIFKPRELFSHLCSVAFSLFAWWLNTWWLIASNTVSKIETTANHSNWFEFLFSLNSWFVFWDTSFILPLMLHAIKLGVLIIFIVSILLVVLLDIPRLGSFLIRKSWGGLKLIYMDNQVWRFILSYDREILMTQSTNGRQ